MSEQEPIDVMKQEKKKMSLHAVYKFYVEGELSESDFRNILKERGYTVIIEGSSRYKYGILKGIIYTTVFWFILVLLFYWCSMIFKIGWGGRF